MRVGLGVDLRVPRSIYINNNVTSSTSDQVAGRRGVAAVGGWMLQVTLLERVLLLVCSVYPG